MGRSTRQQQASKTPFSSLFSELQIAIFGHLYGQRFSERMGRWQGESGYAIAKQVGKEPGAVNVTLRRLFARGFLHRRQWPDAEGGRLIKRYWLTSAGHQAAALLEQEGAFGDTAQQQADTEETAALQLPDRAQLILSRYLEALTQRNAFVAPRGSTDYAQLSRAEAAHKKAIQPYLNTRTDIETCALLLPPLLSFVQVIEEAQRRPATDWLTRWLDEHRDVWSGALVQALAAIILAHRHLFPAEVVDPMRMLAPALS
jgi:DNA-binding MarR family transcriptional regulator